MQLWLSLPFGPSAQAVAMGNQRGKAILGDSLEIKCLYFVSQKAAETENLQVLPKPLCRTYFSEGKVVSSAPNASHEQQPGNFHKPRGQSGAVGEVHPMKVPPALAVAQGHGHTKYSCTQQPKLLRGANCISCAGDTLGTAAVHPKVASVTKHPHSAQEGEEMQLRRCGSERDPCALGSHQPWLLLPQISGISVNLCFTHS